VNRDGQANLSWQCWQQLHSIYHATPTTGRAIATKILDSSPSCPIPEVARLGRTLKAWPDQVLASFDTAGLSTAARKRST
jgi:transposase